MRPTILLSVLVILSGELPLIAASPQEPALFPIQRRAKIGFIDREGNVVIEPQFDVPLGIQSVADFSEGLQPVAKDGKWGYIDRRGTVQIPFHFSQADQFSEGFAKVQVDSLRDGTYVRETGYIDHSGAFKIRAAFEDAGPFVDGVAWAWVNYKVGYIDKTGSYIIEPRFDTVRSSFSEGLAAVCQTKPAEPQHAMQAGQSPKHLCGYIDKTGVWKIQPRFASVSAFHDGLAVVEEEGASGSKYVDHSGQEVDLGAFATVREFSDGVAQVTLRDGRTAFIDRGGKMQFILDRTFHHISPFADGLAQVKNWVQPGGYSEIGYIDRTGKLVIPQIYQGGSDFRNGLAFVALCGQTGYIGKDGQPVWGIAPHRNGPPPESAPLPSGITPELLEGLVDHTDPLTLEVSTGSGKCDPLGRGFWSVTVHSKDRMFPALAINLLEGGSFLTDERIDELQAIREKLRQELDAIARKYGTTSADAEAFSNRPIGPVDHPIGYTMLLGFGPGGSSTAASVFSPDRRYEVQVELSQGSGSRIVKDPFGLTTKIALRIRSVLFGDDR